MPTLPSVIIKSPTAAAADAVARHPLIGTKVRAWVEWRAGGFYDSGALKPDALFRNGEYREGRVVDVQNDVAFVRVYTKSSSRVVTAMVGECVIMTRE